MRKSENGEGQSVGESIGLNEVVDELWSGRWIICVVTAVFILSGVVIAVVLPNRYTAEALLAPNQQDNSSGLAALASQFSGLAGLAGARLSGGPVDSTVYGLEVLKSRQFLTSFVDRHDILVPLIAADGWDPKSRGLEIDSGIYDERQDLWVRDVDPPKLPKPSSQEAYKVFVEDVLSVRHDKQTGMVSVAVTHYSPDVAEQWVDWLVADLNETVMQQDVVEAKRSIEYLNEQAISTSVAGLQSVFYDLIEEQMKTVMLAQATEEYLFKTVDPAIAPEEKSGPRRALILFMFTVAGLVSGMLAVFFVAMRRQDRVE